MQHHAPDGAAMARVKSMSDRIETTQPRIGQAATNDRDWALVRQIGQGDRVAFETLYKQYYEYLFRFTYQVTRRLDVIEDVINETMFVVWEKAINAVPLAKASTWILGIAHNKALNALGRTSARTINVDEGSDEYQRHVNDQGAAVNELETDNLFTRAMLHLSPEQRGALELVYYHGMHYSEIALVTGVPENTVKTRIFHARRKLRDIWPELVGSLVP